ncbi:hypothetical protein ACFU8Q_41065 [Streptomyces sp. NPDC057543]|uniref:hypothetical protein n=1 Tax=Streptomyces sp. NPDC057543 TaxID=3346163 RepID=UPI003674A01B
MARRSPGRVVPWRVPHEAARLHLPGRDRAGRHTRRGPRHPAKEVFDAPRHPHTKAPLVAVVTVGKAAAPVR